MLVCSHTSVVRQKKGTIGEITQVMPTGLTDHLETIEEWIYFPMVELYKIISHYIKFFFFE